MADVSVQRSDWQTGLGAVSQSILLVFVAFLTATLLVYAVSAAGIFSTNTLVGRAALTSLNLLGYGLGTAIFMSVYDDWDLLQVRVPTLREIGWLVAGVVVLFLAAIVMGQVLQSLDVQTAQNRVITEGQQNPTYFLYMIPVALLFVGPFEELLFRGGVQGLLRRAFSAPTAIVGASAIFGAVHLVALGSTGSQLSYVVVAAILGLLLGALYEHTENLVVPAVVHGIYNSLLFLGQYAAATGMLN
jgi:hypothetical protein